MIKIFNFLFQLEVKRNLGGINNVSEWNEIIRKRFFLNRVLAVTGSKEL